MKKRKMGLAAISYDSPEILKEFASRKGLTYPLLSDDGSKTIRAYGILNETVKAGTSNYGIPLPGTLVLDRKGRIIAKYAEADYKERTTLASILEGRFRAPSVSSQAVIKAKRMTLSPHSTATTVASGQHITISLDGELPAKMHVYAPGVTGYKPLLWTMDESPAWKVSEVEFPKPQTLHLKVIDETVPVYVNTFHLKRDLALAMPNAVQPLLDASGNLTVKGTLRYQACDDKECYVPETVPVEWKLRWVEFDRQRAAEAIRHK